MVLAPLPSAAGGSGFVQRAAQHLAAAQSHAHEEAGCGGSSWPGGFLASRGNRRDAPLIWIWTTRAIRHDVRLKP